MSQTLYTVFLVDSYHPGATLYGIYTSVEIAINSGRILISNSPRYDYFIDKCFLNQKDTGTTIWDNICDNPNKKEYRETFKKHWPEGYPK